MRRLLVLLFVLPLIACLANGWSIVKSRSPQLRTTPSAGFLTDRWYFSNVTETNNAPFAIGFVGTGTRVVEWGDGETTTTNGTVVIQHTYATAGSNVFSIRETIGSTTRIYFYNLAGKHRLKRILTEPNGVWSVNSFDSFVNGCTGLTGSIPSISNLTNLTTLFGAFQNCTGLTGEIPTLNSLTNLITIAYAFSGCTGLTGSIPSLSTLTSLISLEFAFNGCTGLTGGIPPLNSLTNVNTIRGAFNGCTGLTGSIPSLSTLTKLTTIATAFYNCRGLLGNTSTVDYIFGSASRSNLTTASQCFYAANGTFTNLLGSAGDFIKLEKSPSFTTNIYSTNGSYRMFYFQTNLTDYATIDAAWK